MRFSYLTSLSIAFIAVHWNNHKAHEIFKVTMAFGTRFYDGDGYAVPSNFIYNLGEDRGNGMVNDETSL